jgi:hypothetical protein
MLTPRMIAILAVTFGIFGCTPPPPKLAPWQIRTRHCTLSAETYRVYDAVMEFSEKQEHGQESSGWPNLMVLREAKLSGGIDQSFWKSTKMTKPSAETLAAFNDLVGCSCSMDPPSDSPIHYMFISEAELHAIFAGDLISDWKKFYQLYPQSGGYWELSPVGFNNAANPNQGLVYICHHCGALCFNGSFVVLQKIQGRWSVKSWRVALVS